MHLLNSPGALAVIGMATTVLATTALGQNIVPALALDQKVPALEGTTLEYPTGQYRNFAIFSGRSINVSPNSKVVWQDTIRDNNSAWLRLYFGDTYLEEGSFIRVTSLLDGAVQELDADTLASWGNTTAYFNGDAVKIELVAAPFSIDNEIAIQRYAFETGRADRGEGNCGICGPDDRAPSSNNNFARLMPVGCSATLYNEQSCMVTAGHCLGESNAVVQFNVPDSNSDGSTVNPGPEDQFPVLSESGLNVGVGGDYGALKIGTNANGQIPHDVYNTFIPLASTVPTSGTMSMNGYGIDSGQLNRSQVQQGHNGPITTVDGSSISYDIDVTFGNSGSSLIANGEIVGIVTHCSSSCENYGSRIDIAGFVQARDIACLGSEPPGGCPLGEIEDCFGNCAPEAWLADTYCDDGTYEHNGTFIYFNCPEFSCDGGDCDANSEPCQGSGDPTGACCVGTDCSVVTATECEGNGGTYLGDSTDCLNSPCAVPTGACCIGQSCADNYTAQECDANNGNYLGDGSSCNGSPCGVTGGEGDTSCDAVVAVIGTNPFDTTGNSDSGFGEPDDTQCTGTYLDWTSSPDYWFVWTAPGNGQAIFSTCDATSFDTSMVLYDGPDCTTTVQVACNGDAAAGEGCQDFFSQINYEVTNGRTYYVRVGGWQAATGAGTLTISGEFGGDPVGACCLQTDCSLQTQIGCGNIGGDYLGDGTNCSNNPCAPVDPTGACCLSNNCFVGTAEDCSNGGGDYQGDSSACADVDCGGGGDPVGACCIGDNCIIETAQACGNSSGLYQGDDTECADVNCGGDDGEFAVKHAIIGKNLISGEEFSYTVDLYMSVPEGHRVDAVAGTPDQNKMLTCSGTFYQNANGGPTSTDINPNFYEFDNDLEWDSRVTIGCIDITGNPHPENNLQNIGINWAQFESGADLSTDNGIWFHLPTDPAGEAVAYTDSDCVQEQGVLLARLTILGQDSEVGFSSLVQGRDSSDVIFQEEVETYFGYSSMEDCNGNLVADVCDIANGTSIDANDNGIPDECDNSCPGDVDNNGVVNVDDILDVLGNFGSNNGDGDINGDGVCNVDDVLEVLSYFGESC
jgi:V8-like Glu-specific endopeptidase